MSAGDVSVPASPQARLKRTIDALEATLVGRVTKNAPLGARTTYRVGGTASVYVEASSVPDLRAVHLALASAGGPVPVLVLGQGSNLLVADSGFAGVVIGLGAGFDWVEIEGTCVRAGGATKLPVLARRTAGAGLSGLEWAVGIPGSVGGALRMNAGGHGSDTAAVLRRYEVFDLSRGETEEHGAEDLRLAYRASALSPAQVVTWARFALSPGHREHSRQVLSEIVRWRREHQPGGSNAGSVFVNPPGSSAGELVERAGLKGLRMGSATVSALHANFIQADDGGSADDVRRLMEHVRAVVASVTGVGLRSEVRLVGFADSVPPLVEASRTEPKAQLEDET